jgi:DNA polymerase-3 subunit epsilon
MSDDAKNKVPAIADLGPRFFYFLEKLERPIVFFDLETTGTDPLRDRIIEICLLRVNPLPTAIEAPRTWRVNPGMRIPSESSAVHGIGDDDISGAPPFAEIADEVAAQLEGADLGGFAITRMDVRLLHNELQRVGKSLDLNTARMVDAQVIFHRREPRDLTAALRFYRDKPLEDAHGAEADTVAALEVFAGQLERYEDLDLEVPALHVLSTSHNAGFVDGSRRFVWRDGEPAFNFGKLKGKSLRWAASEPSEREYLRFILSGPFEEDTREVVREALAGRIRRRD